MPEVKSRVGANSVEEVLADFDRLKEHFDELCDATARLIETILKVKGIAIHSLQARVKSREKLRSKYCKSNKDYKSLGDISDLVGLRIITFYSDTLDPIAEIIGREFEERGKREDKRVGELDAFGYSAIHMDCAYSQDRRGSTEYRAFAKARFEIQVTTILGHAWAEMQHPWYDELDSPPEETRRFHRLAAVLELAEQEFLEVRKKKESRERIASVRVAAKAPETLVTRDSLNAFLDENVDDIATLDCKVAAALFDVEPMLASLNTGPLAEVVSGAGISTVQQLEDKLRLGRDAVIEFARQTKPIYDACGRPNAKTYGRGISILHLSYLLARAAGEVQLRSTYEEAGLQFLPGFNLGLFLKVARDVATKFGLI